jgi:hypothetical protein
MMPQKQVLKIKPVQEQRIILRRVLFLTSSVVLLLFLGLFICINLADPGSATATSASSQTWLVSH